MTATEERVWGRRPTLGGVNMCGTKSSSSVNDVDQID
jgi:hypothetical protein